MAKRARFSIDSITPKHIFVLTAIIIILEIVLATSVFPQSGATYGVKETYTRGCLPGAIPSPTTCLPDSMFRDLSKMPDDFGPVRALILSGRVQDICGKVDERYYEQPESYDTFYKTGLPQMLKSEPGREVVAGFGSFPAETFTTVSNSSGIVKTCFFLSTAWKVDRFQPLSIMPAFPDGTIGFTENKFPDGTKSVTQNATDVKKYISITTSPSEVILEPAWGYLYRGWVRKIDVTINVAPNTPKGKYIVGVNPSGIGGNRYQDLLWKYKTLLSSFPGIGLDRPMYLIGIDVQ